MPIQASRTGIVRPPRRRYEKRLLPMANKTALIFDGVVWCFLSQNGS